MQVEEYKIAILLFQKQLCWTVRIYSIETLPIKETQILKINK